MAKPAKASNTRLYLRVLRYLAPDGRHLILAVVLGLLTSLFSVVSIYTILPLLDAVFSTNKAGASVATMPEQITATASISPTALSALDSQRLKEQVLAYLKALLYSDTQENTLRNICLFLVITFLLKNFFLYLNNRLMVYVETKSANKLRNHVFEKILSLGLDYFHRHRVGMLMQRVGSDIYLIQTQVSGSLMNLLRNGILAVCYLAVLIIVSWKLTLFAFGVSLLSLAAIRFISQVIRRQADVIQDRSGEMNARAQEVFSGIKLVKAMVTEAFEAKRFATLTDLYRRATLKIYSLRGALSPLNETLGISAIAGVLWFGGLQVFQGEMTSSELVFFAFGLYSIMSPIKVIAETNARVQEGMSAAAQLFEILDTEPKIQSGKRRISRIEKGITFEKVWFRYGEQYVLRDVSFEIRVGEVVALVGPSGSGKSTIVDLLLRFYDVERGAILIDGINIKEFDLQDLRRLFGVVSQEVVLFNDTVANNIRYGAGREVSEAEIVAAAKIANAHHFIMELPEQYQTVIGERGVRLSGGQRQRLSIARAMLKNPPMLIFDEATSALDNESEKLVQDAIDQAMQQRTALVIAHRLSTIKNANTILVLERGEIRERGNHFSLLQQDGLYKRFYEMQFALEQSSETNAT
ncbi:MAG: ABC transporter ATP-binding protein [Chloroherpetonaceae bacterium]|nr:ABC transporter ATP-binding protein/permease [Chloroherpetonaceae bacterium]MCS7211546.1 ABC transporter ATP-binding protein/permease [Chloroherpetonaceae bacterium]MDW8019820.1 ABC transporter ATP-binding protein [Chloroherpetonaceae bacterium]